MVSAIVAISGCATVPDGGEVASVVISFRDLVDRPGEFDGKLITVRGYMMLEPELRGFTEKKVSSAAASDVVDCLTLAHVPGQLRKKAPIGRYVRLTGVFKENINDGYVDLAACGDNGIEILAVKME
jgi:hypothetical protein